MTPRRTTGYVYDARGTTERTAGGIVLSRRRGELVVAMIRKDNGAWGFPKGRIERGETPLVAARREVKEEIGLRTMNTIAPLGEIHFWFTPHGLTTKVHKYIYFFLFFAPRPFELFPQREEFIERAEWVPWAVVREKIGYRNMKTILDKAQRLIQEKL